MLRKPAQRAGIIVATYPSVQVHLAGHELKIHEPRLAAKAMTIFFEPVLSLADKAYEMKTGRGFDYHRTELTPIRKHSKENLLKRSSPPDLPYQVERLRVEAELYGILDWPPSFEGRKTRRSKIPPAICSRLTSCLLLPPLVSRCSSGNWFGFPTQTFTFSLVCSPVTATLFQINTYPDNRICRD